MRKLNQSIRTGISFGVTSAIITTLGLFIGLSASTSNKLIVFGGILTIAIADAFSDALGIHLSVESDKRKNNFQIWKSTLSAFFTKLVIGFSFLIPILFFDLNLAIIIGLVYGLSLLAVFSYFLARDRGDNPLFSILEHLFIALIVIILTEGVGRFISFLIG